MDTAKVANWLQIVGNLGIVGGLVLVAVQINQSSEIARAEQISKGYEYVMQIPVQMPVEVIDAYAKSYLEPLSLTERDYFVLGAKLTGDFIGLMRLNRLEEAGLTYPNTLQRTVESFIFQYGDNAPARALWEVWLADTAEPRIRDMINAGFAAGHQPSVEAVHDGWKQVRVRTEAILKSEKTGH